MELCLRAGPFKARLIRLFGTKVCDLSGRTVGWIYRGRLWFAT